MNTDQNVFKKFVPQRNTSLRVPSTYLQIVLLQLLEVSFQQEVSPAVHDKAAKGLALDRTLLGCTLRQMSEITGHSPTLT